MDPYFLLLAFDFTHYNLTILVRFSILGIDQPKIQYVYTVDKPNIFGLS